MPSKSDWHIIAVDIPSVYGRYRERKFDALGLTFRLENLTTVYLERIPETVNTAFITEATFIRIIRCLKFYLRALKIDGTARGGQTSHASLVALRLDKTCVVGCKNLKVFETEGRCEIGGHVIRCGDPISIDGRKGLFLKGMHPLKREVHILPI